MFVSALRRILERAVAGRTRLNQVYTAIAVHNRLGKLIVVIVATAFIRPALPAVLYGAGLLGGGVGDATDPDKDKYTSTILSFGVWNTGPGCNHTDTGLSGDCTVVFNQTVTLSDVGKTLEFNGASSSFQNSVNVVQHHATFDWDAAATWPPPHGGAEIQYALNQPAVSGYIQSFDLHLNALCFSTNESCTLYGTGGLDDTVEYDITFNGRVAPEPASWALMLFAFSTGVVLLGAKRLNLTITRRLRRHCV